MVQKYVKQQRQLDRERQQIQKARRTQLEKAAPDMVKEIEDLKALAIKLGNEKAALLAAHKKALLELAFLVMEVDCWGGDKPIQETLKSAIKAGEA